MYYIYIYRTGLIPTLGMEYLIHTRATLEREPSAPPRVPLGRPPLFFFLLHMSLQPVSSRPARTYREQLRSCAGGDSAISFSLPVSAIRSCGVCDLVFWFARDLARPSSIRWSPSRPLARPSLESARTYRWWKLFAGVCRRTTLPHRTTIREAIPDPRQGR